jgi:hypothetical protein
MRVQQSSKRVEVPLALYERLREIARSGEEPTNYKAVAPFAGIIPKGQGFMTKLRPLLDEINDREHAADRPLLSAVVVAKKTGIPGVGFFTYARGLGLHTGTDDRAYWQVELQKVRDYWSRH